MSDGEQFPLKPASNDRMCVHTITWEEGDLCCQGASRVCFHLNSTLGLGVGRTGDIQGGARNDVTFYLDTWVQFIQHWQMIWWVPLLDLCCSEVLGTN